MMKQIILPLLVILSTMTLRAQDGMEQTTAPSFSCSMLGTVLNPYEYSDDYREIYIQNDFFVSITNNDDVPATIYYRVVQGSGPDEWTILNENEPIICTATGADYTFYIIEAYAQAEGKLPSDVVNTADIGLEITPAIFLDYKACVVDGINYLMGEGYEVSVCSDGHPAFPSDSYYTGDVIIPEEIVFWDETYRVWRIHDYAFYHCGVTSVDIPSTVSYVGSQAFYDCRSLTKVTCRAKIPPISYYSFEGDYDDQDVIYRNAKLYVPYESLEDYRADEEWGRFTHIVPFIGAGPGDIDGSGGIDVDDVTGIIDMILEGGVPEYADVNGDGSIDIDDISAILNMLLGGH